MATGNNLDQSQACTHKGETMEQHEVDEIIRLARRAILAETSQNEVQAKEFWRELMEYILIFALDRANKTLAYERENPGVL